MDLLEKLKCLGFIESEQDNNLLLSTIDPLIRIKIDKKEVKKSTIDYMSAGIVVWNKATSNLNKAENLVVLECVLRLLKKGYAANCIELERTWKSGGGTSGRLDILVKDKEKKSYAMIECKTWGEEYATERNNMIEDGGQLFAYFVQEMSTKVLLLYASTIQEDVVLFTTEAIDCKTLQGSNNQELFQSWDNSFVNESIFAENATLYFSQKQNLVKKNLKELDQETGRGLFNSFSEILRRYAISDKSNAFNKIFNLFVCKIYDEDTKRSDEELDFQWKTNDSYKHLTQRLGVLYQKGINDYLQIEVEEGYFVPDSEFTFIDVYNAATYNRNYAIIKEVVELLQKYQLKYTSKHQFLGDFFEDLLNTGVKQEAGQFFTPTPLSRFFLKSIPIEGIIEEKIASKNPHILPFVIDYACGAGHFLTEAIDEFQQHIDRIDTRKLVGRVQSQFLAIKDNFYWAKDYVYGIEKDYRLTKTTKVAMFLYGDGDAVIINGDGLDDFKKSDDYIQLLKVNQPQKRLEKFDIVISNPPFSIANFKQNLRDAATNFSLHQFVTPKSAEIECFFVERTHQLLTENGIAGIILPLSILNNESRIYTETRKLMLLNFELKSIVELRDKTFKPTNTTTVGLFLQKRTQKTIQDAVVEIYNVCVQEIKNPILEQLIGADKKALKTYFTTQNDTEKTIRATFFEGCGLDNTLSSILIQYLNLNKKTVVVYAGEKKEQEAFLGYRYSKIRGREGFELFKNDDGSLATLLYDENNLMNVEKVNAHIQANFKQIILPIPEKLQSNLMYIDSNLLLQKQDFVLSNPSSYFESDNYVIQSNSLLGDVIDTYPQQSYDFKDLILTKQLTYFSGLVYNKKAEVPRKTNKKVFTASNLDLQTGKLNESTKLIHLDEAYILPEELKPKKDDIIISNASGSLKHLGKVVLVTENYEDSVIGGFLSIIRCTDKKLSKALFYRLLSYGFRKHITGLRGQNINNLDLDKIQNFDLNLPLNLDDFYNDMTQRETDLQDLQDKLQQMKA